MNEQIVKSLNSIMVDENILYVLKGFNFADLSNLKINHVFDLKLNEDIENLIKIDNKKLMTDNLPLLMSKNSFYCYYEELFVWEKNICMKSCQC